ncbi:Gfo/Idh/MocA family protein [Desertihabitans aurantiacus]|uniref:Gfo/Idh/MocA family protein n=1 Tax=Desertihabitans aurantiacus TaxID=2282477 RepID=UPI000DF81F3B|nr:Gfo/Idh/MocA family oxidoreductase [Desertihabitans aurantiacus]
MGEPMNLALIGCGNIAGQYLASLQRLPGLRLVAVCDAVPAAAERVSAETGVPARPVEDVLADPSVEVVLNLTIPAAHAPVTIAALEAGKHVYLEKPFATSLADADAMVAAAEKAGRRIGSAPDTVLGTGIQTARQLVDSGRIGIPVAATAFMMNPGHESWHPNPAFYYQHGGGPLLDMGVYYLTALVTLLGPVESVTAMGSRIRTERPVPAGAPRAGEVLTVEVDTHISAVLRHTSGVTSTLVVSFDAVASQLPRIEVYGSEATLDVPDPNRFDDPVRICATPRSRDFTEVEPTAGYRGSGRGYGLADMARAIAEGGPHRQSTELGYHVNEVMERVLESIREQRQTAVVSRCERPAAVPLDATPDVA